MAIRFAPIFSVPIHRHCEVLSVAFVIFCELLCGPICAFLTICLLCFGNLYWRAVCLIYLAFIYYDRHSGDRGGRRLGSKWLRDSSIWWHCKNYFPVDLVKTVDLPANQNYLLCAYPHGVVSLGVGVNCGSNHSKWDELFPGIRPKCATLSCSFYMPIGREILLNCGFCSASANSLKTLLNQSNDSADKSNDDGYTSNAVVVVVGGAREAFNTIPNTYRCILKNRKGFVRIALQTGTPIVPVISFGESNLYDLIDYKPGSLVRSIQDTIKRYTYVAPIHYNGRGLLQYNFGLLPKRHPITTVIGAPIYVEKMLNPTDENINQTHAIFCNQLIELFETHKSKYVKNFDKIHLEII